MKRIALKRLKEVLRYHPTTGVWRWTENCPVRGGRGIKPGDRAGTMGRGDGYRILNVDQHCYRSSVLAFFYMTGKWPRMRVDHKNRIRDDDRWHNLRLVTNSQHRQNSSHLNNQTGLKGVVVHAWGRRKRFSAAIHVEGKSRCLGYFATPQEAHVAYVTAAKKHFGEYACAG